MIARKLERKTVEKPWGMTDLPSPFEALGAGRPIGEIWFEPPEGAPLLAKYLFTSERLSIQVHPDDRQARARGLPAGKEECWIILDAAPGAVLGIGTREPLDAGALEAAARSGEIERLMQWHPVSPGMVIHVPPGTVHAIGPGLVLVEIQQNSDVTYRLYDYGRPRDLHLDDGTAVARAGPVVLAGADERPVSRVIVEGEHFSVARIVGEDISPLADAGGEAIVLPLEGEARAGEIVARPGDCVAIDDIGAVRGATGAVFLVAWPAA